VNCSSLFSIYIMVATAVFQR